MRPTIDAADELENTVGLVRELPRHPVLSLPSIRLRGDGIEQPQQVPLRDLPCLHVPDLGVNVKFEARAVVQHD